MEQTVTAYIDLITARTKNRRVNTKPHAKQQTRENNMRMLPPVALAAIAGLYSTAAFSAPGEYWKVTSKVDIPNIPITIAPVSFRICLPRDGGNDLRQMTHDKNNNGCRASDIKTSGNKTTWKIRCKNSSISGGTGEITRSENSYKGVLHLNGRHGKITQTYTGKLIGGECDTEAPVRLSNISK